MGAKKINSELEQIFTADLDTMIKRRLEWANARGKRIEFLSQLKAENITGKQYSDKVAQYDRENAKVSWAL